MTRRGALCEARIRKVVSIRQMADLVSIREHYESELAKSTDSAKRVGWRDDSAQFSRFDCIIRVLDGCHTSSLSDVGCGRGDFLKYLCGRDWPGSYVGTDISPKMIAEAATRSKQDTRAKFVVSESPLQADFLVASGIFNVSLGSEIQTWTVHCEKVLRKMWEASGRGIAFS